MSTPVLDPKDILAGPTTVPDHPVLTKLLYPHPKLDDFLAEMDKVIASAEQHP